MAQPFKWTDSGVMVPLRPKLADATYCVGEVYFLEIEEQRNMAQHRAYFASVNEAWKNLPEAIADEFPSPTHLRSHALVERGFCTDRRIDAGAKAGAERIAAYVRGEKPFAHVVTRGTIVIIREPESQSVKSMGAERFKQSMRAVEDVIAGLIGVSPEALRENAGRSAA